MKKRIPLGMSEFRKVVEEGCYYIDKTNLITELAADGSEVVLFTRPRRFGKTLNMTMLREFFDITKDSKSLFQGLYVEQQTCFEEINAYPTLFFSFRDCKGSKRELIQSMKYNLMSEYQRYLFLQNGLSEYDQKKYFDIYRELEDDGSQTVEYTTRAISFLCKLLFQHYQKPVVLLVDEYDTPMIESYTNGYYDELRSFFTTLFGSALKDNVHLKRGIVTGIQRVAKENIFSGLNNLTVITVKDWKYRQYFGFTPEETGKILSYYGLELTEDVKQMYNGYNFGGQQIYNPWSILNYADKKQLFPSWINSSSNALIRSLIREAGRDFKDDFELLIAEKEVVTTVDVYTSFWEMKQTETLWGLLLNAGYITLKDTNTQMTSTIVIPNLEVKSEFRRIVGEYTQIGESSLGRMFSFLVEAFDLRRFKQTYENIILRNTSFYDAKENAYHMLFLGMSIYLDGYYDVKSNIETGKGRSDIVLKSMNPSKHPHVLIEFKQGEDVEQLAKEALEQIKGKRYDVDLQGKTILLGIAHNKKECEIISEEIWGIAQN